MHLLDRRWQGTAVGVGTSKILGERRLVPSGSRQHCVNCWSCRCLTPLVGLRYAPMTQQLTAAACLLPNGAGRVHMAQAKVGAAYFPVSIRWAGAGGPGLVLAIGSRRHAACPADPMSPAIKAVLSSMLLPGVDPAAATAAAGSTPTLLPALCLMPLPAACWRMTRWSSCLGWTT